MTRRRVLKTTQNTKVSRISKSLKRTLNKKLCNQESNLHQSEDVQTCKEIKERK